MVSAADPVKSRERSRYGRALLGLGVALVALAGAISLSRSEGPSDGIAAGVVVFGHDLGGKSDAEARAELEIVAQEVGRKELVLTAGGKELRAHAAEVGAVLDVDQTATAAIAVGHSGGFGSLLRAVNRTRTDIPLVVTVDRDALAEAAPAWQAALGVDLPFDGAVELDGAAPIAKLPHAGRRVDLDGLANAITTALAAGADAPIVVPFVDETPPISADAVNAAVARARVILSGPITLTYTPSEEEIALAQAENEEAEKRQKETEDRAKFQLPPKKRRMKHKSHRLVVEKTPPKKADLVPIPEPIEVTWSQEDLLAAFRADRVDEPTPSFVVQLDESEVKRKLAPVVAKLFDAARDARFEIDAANHITIVPSRPGTRVDSSRLVDALYAAAGTADRRGELPVDKKAQPQFTTEAATALGIKGPVAEFTTHHPCCQDRVKNIHHIADMLDGTIVRAGETFSVNSAIGPRTLQRGFFLAPSIGDGEMVETPGGGISQFATTFYNALFNGGYSIKEHKPHSYYFSRYPLGIEATLSYPKPDLAFYNDTSSAVLIRCDYGSTFIRVRLFGDNGGRTVDRKVSAPFDFTDPKIEYIPNAHRDPEKEKVKESGSNGYSVVVQRVTHMPDGTTREEKRTVVYNARPRVLEVHPCKIPKDEKGWTGEKCPEPEKDESAESGEGGSAPVPEN